MNTESTEECIESIYKLGHEGTPTSLKSLADYLHLKPATVLEKVNRLIKLGIARRVDKKGIVLTRAGEKQAIDIIRKHRLAERFLVDVLGLPWEEVHDDACKFEHIMSDKVADALEKFLNHPESCPHGHPIPDRRGRINKEQYSRLSELGAMDCCQVVRVSEDSPQHLRYLATLGLFPDTPVKVEQVAPFNGPLLVRVRDSCYAVGREIAKKIWVKKDPPRNE